MVRRRVVEATVRVLAWVEHPEPTPPPARASPTRGQRRRNSACDGEPQLRRHNGSFGKCRVRASSTQGRGRARAGDRGRGRASHGDRGRGRASRGDRGRGRASHGDGGPLKPEAPARCTAGTRPSLPARSAACLRTSGRECPVRAQAPLSAPAPRSPSATVPGAGSGTAIGIGPEVAAGNSTRDARRARTPGELSPRATSWPRQR